MSTFEERNKVHKLFFFILHLETAGHKNERTSTPKHNEKKTDGLKDNRSIFSIWQTIGSSVDRLIQHRVLVC